MSGSRHDPSPAQQIMGQLRQQQCEYPDGLSLESAPKSTVPFGKLPAKAVDEGKSSAAKYSAPHAFEVIRHHDGWAGCRSIVMLEGQRQLPEVTRKETAFFISYFPTDAKLILPAVRAHWSSENTFHSIHDVTFQEQVHDLEDKAILVIPKIPKDAMSKVAGQTTWQFPPIHLPQSAVT